jgi:two-component system, chemotaxis family, chemotaxis protein CheY
VSDRSAVLVVDDDPAILATVAEYLDLEGVPVETAANGREALSKVDGAPPAVVLLDMRMPVMDGWSFVDELRRRGYDVPILVMTAAHDATDWAAEIGAVGCVAKPFEVDDLLEAVQRLLP